MRRFGANSSSRSCCGETGKRTGGQLPSFHMRISFLEELWYATIIYKVCSKNWEGECYAECNEICAGPVFEKITVHEKAG